MLAFLDIELVADNAIIIFGEFYGHLRVPTICPPMNG